MSAQKLSDRCGELGVPIERSVLAGLENRKRAKISLAEVLVLGMALNVAPILLIFPVGDVESVEVLPDKFGSPFDGVRWFSGSPTDSSDFFPPHDYWAYQDSVEKLNDYRQHDNLVSAMHDTYMQLHPTPGRRSRPGYKEPSPERIATLTRILEDYGGLLQHQRNNMDAKGMLLPPLPAEAEEYLLNASTMRMELERWGAVRTWRIGQPPAADDNEAER